MDSPHSIFLYTKQDSESLKMKNAVLDLAARFGFSEAKAHAEAALSASIGDDGTFLQAVRKTGFRQDCLYAGLSTTGSLDMYCDFHYRDMHELIDAASEEEIAVRRYPLIEVTVDGNPPLFCLNEFSIRSNIVKSIVVDLFVDGHHFESFRGDGLIASTPTGSTAYSKSVFGAVIDPLIPCFQVSEVASINNNHYRTLGSPFILSGSRSLELRLHKEWNDFPSMGMDNEALSIRQVERVQIRLSNHVVRTVKLKSNSFWQKVQRTFL